MADKTGTGDMAMTVQRAAKDNLERERAEITLPKGWKNRADDGRVITHIVKKKETNENGGKKSNNVYPPSPFPPLEHPPICLST